jgi:hypothetical protein
VPLSRTTVDHSRIRIANFGFGLSVLLFTGCSWYQPHQEEIANYIEIPMAKALKTAINRVPGKAIEAKLIEDSTRLFYKIDIVDKQQKIRTVYVDAENGLLLKVDH